MQTPSVLRAACLAALATFASAAFAASPPALVEAAKAGDTPRALALLREADADAAEADGTTALHWAVRNDDVELATRLLEAG
ncbi:MAG TPA: ankyrin repeat domain-containing protein, partial [Burkholderiales bacterium]